MAKGAAWMVLFKLSERSLGLISTIVLARLLIPQDFGIVALATSVIAVLELFSAFSFDIALIQNQQAERRHYDTAWTFNVLFAIVSALVLVLLAVPASHFYSEPGLKAVIYTLAIGTVIGGFENIGIVAFRKELQFNKEFKFLIAKKLISFTVTVTMAFWLQNYWALVIGMLTNKSAGLLISYIAHPYRPRLSLAAYKELIHFSKWLLINNFLHFLTNRGNDFIIGKLVGAKGLGLFNISYEISNLTSTQLVAPINRAVLPGYAKYSDSLEKLREGYLNVSSLIIMFALPAATGIAAVAQLFVPVVLGEKWLATIPLIQVLAFYGAINALEANVYIIYITIGKPKITTYLSTLHVSILIPVLIFATMHYGIEGSAWGFLVTTLSVLPLKLFVLFKNLQLKFHQYLATTWRTAVSSALLYLAVSAYVDFSRVNNTLASEMGHFIIAVILGVVVFVSAILGLWWLSGKPRHAELLILEKLAQRFHKHPPKNSQQPQEPRPQ